MKSFNFEYSSQPASLREREDENVAIGELEDRDEPYLDEEGNDTEAGLDLEAQHREADRIMLEKAEKEITKRQEEREREELEKAREEDREELERTFRRF